MIHGVIENKLVDFFSLYARRNMLGEHIKAARDKLAGVTHRLEGGGSVNLDLAGFP
jgi:hypothetical protein